MPLRFASLVPSQSAAISTALAKRGSPASRVGPPASLWLLATLAGCSPTVSPAPLDRDFSGEQAHALLIELMGEPRTLGHPRRERSIDGLAQRLSERGARVSRQPFEASATADAPTFSLTNVVAEFRPEAERRFVLATHFDTRPWAEEDPDPARRFEPIPGANDGTSGVAVLLALVPLLERDLPPEVGFTIMLFDGEELGDPTRPREGYCMGSRQLAHLPDRGEPWRSASFGIVLDMVADKALDLRRDPISTRTHHALVKHVWTVAKRRGHAGFIDAVGPGLIDDNVYLTAAGVPSILLIDRNYSAWHTHADDVDQISAESLGQVGDTLHRALVDPRVWALQPNRVRRR